MQWSRLLLACALLAAQLLRLSMQQTRSLCH
jgi:hypothetical protein